MSYVNFVHNGQILLVLTCALHTRPTLCLIKLFYAVAEHHNPILGHHACVTMIFIERVYVSSVVLSRSDVEREHQDVFNGVERYDNEYRCIRQYDNKYPAPINSRLNVVVRSPAPFGLGRNGCWPFRGSQLPQTLPFIFSLCCPLNDRRRAAQSFFKIGRLFSLFLFSYPSLALLRLLILLLLLMSGNVHPNPGPIFPCSVCTGNVTWRGKSVQCCACSKWVHLRCSQLSLSQFRALGSSHSWSCPPCRITVTSSLDSSNMYTSTVQSSPASANAALSPHPRLQTSYPPSAHSISSPYAPPPPSLAPGFSSAPPASTPPPPLESLTVLQ